MKQRAVQQQESSPDRPRRRNFLNWLWAGLATLACMEVGWFAGSILKNRRLREEQRLTSSLVDAGMVQDYSPGEVTAIPEGSFYLACLEDNSFIALSRTCTHLGCSVPWDDKQKKFVCPCHGSTFDSAGSVLTPPATRPLDYFPVRIENGSIRVDISSPLKRGLFKPSQASRE